MSFVAGVGLLARGAGGGREDGGIIPIIHGVGAGKTIVARRTIHVGTFQVIAPLLPFGAIGLLHET